MILICVRIFGIKYPIVNDITNDKSNNPSPGINKKYIKIKDRQMSFIVYDSPTILTSICIYTSISLTIYVHVHMYIYATCSMFNNVFVLVYRELTQKIHRKESFL